MLNILFIPQFFRKKQYSPTKPWKTFGSVSDHFLEKEGVLTKKSNITFLITNYVLNILLFNSFFKKSCIFREKCEKPFLGAKSLLKVRGRPGTKMKTTFFMGNEVLNIFSSTNFFKEMPLLRRTSCAKEYFPYNFKAGISD